MAEDERDVENQASESPKTEEKISMSIYEEARRPLLASYLMFVIPDIRNLIRQGEIDKSDPDLIQRVLECPCSFRDVATLYNENLDRIRTMVACDERVYMYQEAWNLSSEELDTNSVLHVDDARSEEECVYAIGINHVLKRVTVAFRGSVTTKDFQQDAKAILSNLKNPVAGPPDNLAIHFGFKEYLYGEEGWTDSLFLGSTAREGRNGALQLSSVDADTRTTNTTSANEDKQGVRAESTHTETKLSMKKEKYKIIMTQLEQVFQECPDYSLYICGHSLGGALATLFAFECAAATHNDQSSIPHPVTVITSGAPKVGNIDFLLAFESLEEQGRLRCLHVANYRDIVTLSPPIGALALCHAICCQERRFRHVGFRLKLKPRGYVISFPPKVRSYCGILVFDLLKMVRSFFFMMIFIPLCAIFTCGTKKFLRGEHTQLVYMNRFDRQKKRLESVSLDELYAGRFARARWRIPVFHAGGAKQFIPTHNIQEVEKTESGDCI